MNHRICFAFALTLLMAATANAQSDTQTFTMTVPSTIAITAPSAATATHDESDNDVAFSTQQWTVTGNAAAGVTVSFSTATAFINTIDSGYKRDVQLGVAVGTTEGPATWSVDTASDTTDYGGADEVATVAVSSDGVGNAAIDLTVTFKTVNYGTFLAGDYATTVTGTVTSN
ncbi:MAG: hypothetical protein KDA61_20720 [Planctomycetales bacterium]|nr:hypothetical protein [Planctomycetales bacterium]